MGKPLSQQEDYKNAKAGTWLGLTWASSEGWCLLSLLCSVLPASYQPPVLTGY